MKRRIWSWMLVLALFFGSLPAIHAEEADVPKVPTEEIERVTEEAPKESAETTGESPDSSEYPVVASVGNRRDFQISLFQTFNVFQRKFAIRYLGSDADQIERELKEAWLHSKGDFFYGPDYRSWLVNRFEFRRTYDQDGLLFRFDVGYYYTMEQEEEMDRMIDDALFKLIHEEMNDYRKIAQINRYIVLTKSCSTNMSPYQLMKEGHGDDYAYAKLAYKMLEKLGFEVCMVESEGSKAWLKVKVYADWFNFSPFKNEYDACDPNSRKFQWNAYLMSDEAWNKKYEPQKPGVNYPAATWTNFDSDSDGEIEELSEAELWEVLLKGRIVSYGEMYESDGWIRVKGKKDYGKRRIITVTFNQALEESDLKDKIALYQLDTDGYLIKRDCSKRIKGNQIIIDRGSYFPIGIYFVEVREGIVAKSGKVSTEKYYRRIYVREQ